METKTILRVFCGTLMVLSVWAQAGEVTMQEKVSYGGWPNCIRLSNGDIELIVTTDVGPRVIRLGFVGGQNFFSEFADQMGKTGGEEWRIYGGHRLWHAPEAMPRTYALDNGPVSASWDGKTLKITQPTEETTGIQKEMEITLAENENRVNVLHRLINRNLWDVELAAWALTVMAKNGRGIYPQEPFRPHPDYLLPARPMVLWHYTDLSDPRWTFTSKYIQLQQNPKATTKQKVGLLNKQGWVAYALNNEVFIKRFGYQEGAAYPDYGCNFETFTNADMLEIESVGPLTKLAANGGSVEHVETWHLFRADVGKTDAEIDAALLPLVEKTKVGAP